jgi:hypothetical protein
MKYIGIADAHGLESFIPAKKFDIETESLTLDNKAIAFMKLRSDANRHRHAVVYMADVSPSDAETIVEMQDRGEALEALEFLKEVAKSVSLIKSPGAEKSWNLIPNPDLDPFS